MATNRDTFHARLRGIDEAAHSAWGKDDEEMRILLDQYRRMEAGHDNRKDLAYRLSGAKKRDMELQDDPRPSYYGNRSSAKDAMVEWLKAKTNKR